MAKGWLADLFLAFKQYSVEVKTVGRKLPPHLHFSVYVQSS